MQIADADAAQIAEARGSSFTCTLHSVLHRIPGWSGVGSRTRTCRRGALSSGGDAASPLLSFLMLPRVFCRRCRLAHHQRHAGLCTGRPRCPPSLDALSARTDIEEVRLYHLHIDGPALTSAAHGAHSIGVALQWPSSRTRGRRARRLRPHLPSDVRALSAARWRWMALVSYAPGPPWLLLVGDFRRGAAVQRPLRRRRDQRTMRALGTRRYPSTGSTRSSTPSCADRASAW